MDNPEHVSASNIPSVNIPLKETGTRKDVSRHRVTIDQLLLAGAHFGHLTQRWNPKMKRYIFSSLNGIYLIDLNQTQELLEEACQKAARIAASGNDILFIGTKKQARDIVQAEAQRAECPYVTYRWLGGMLTNFSTIRRSLKTLEGFERKATDGTYEKLTKKEQLQIEKSKGKLLRVLGGVRDMRRLPGAVFIVDTNREAIAVAEARKLGIPVFAIIDTNVDPDLVDFPIPANDDAFKSIGLIARIFAESILEGKHAFKETQVVEETAVPEQPRSRSRRSRRRRSRRDRPPMEQGADRGVSAERTPVSDAKPRLTEPGKDKPDKVKAEKTPFREQKPAESEPRKRKPEAAKPEKAKEVKAKKVEYKPAEVSKKKTVAKTTETKTAKSDGAKAKDAKSGKAVVKESKARKSKPEESGK
ncbi:30S ribosomal protein S2 [bacterium]|nr:30S ribosomal protein S2 [bacterium]